ncbi:TonB-dependent receptor [Caulobacter segnis]|uniref:TonB-dependent receptor domain-containing protein n=1 Tax=Caulobacter segnis TaxID=88688 RepID=UPI00240F5FB1|nr:TonB-dependent receptor [Caulobacter segnis]MDG2522516.1 TonB-dependent receptor [Caulobacter segnis]
MSAFRFISFTAALLCACAPATLALAQDNNAAQAAEDAFGERQGVEQIGLYDEGQVRGFDLGNSGAYRIDGAYFARTSYLADPILQGVGVMVGVGASRLDFTSPSGVVNYRLRDVGTDNRLTVSAGMRDYETPFTDLNGALVSQDGRFGIVGGALLRPDVQWNGGGKGEAYDYGALAQWRPSDALRARAFVSYSTRDYNGDSAFMTTDGGLPPDAAPLTQHAPSWSTAIYDQTNLGLLIDARVMGWSLDASAFRSTYDPERTDFTVLAVNREGQGTATTWSTPSRAMWSDSAELRAARVFRTGDLSHRISIAARGRISETELAAAQRIPLGAFDYRRPPEAPQPVLIDDGRRGLDRVEQITGSLGYALAWGPLTLRAGLHRTRYDKSFRQLDGGLTERVQSRWFHNASATWALNDRATLFGSWTTGLEETGTAPKNAANRDEVLPPVQAEQFELGVRYALTPDLTLIAATFDASKPTTGLRADNVFTLVGQVRHRGVEASLAGDIRPGTSVVIGGMWMDPKVSGELVDSGQIGALATGLSRAVINANIEQTLPFAPGWSVDANLGWWSGRKVTAASDFQAQANAQLLVGTRYRFKIADNDAVFRAAVVNALDDRGWWGDPAEYIWKQGPRTYRASLTVTF